MQEFIEKRKDLFITAFLKLVRLKCLDSPLSQFNFGDFNLTSTLFLCQAYFRNGYAYVVPHIKNFYRDPNDINLNEGESFLYPIRSEENVCSSSPTYQNKWWKVGRCTFQPGLLSSKNEQKN